MICKCKHEMVGSYEKTVYSIGDGKHEEVVRTVYVYINRCYHCGNETRETQDSSNHKDS